MASWTASVEPRARPWWARVLVLLTSSGLARH
jgi:hypothetical protein